jgi:hypothetical protein
MEAVRKIQWVGYAIGVVGATLMLVSDVFLLQPQHVRKAILVAGFCLVFTGSTMKLLGALKEKRAWPFQSGPRTLNKNATL